MIFVAAGTEDARAIAFMLDERGFRVTASVTTEYGGGLFAERERIIVNKKPLDAAGLADYMMRHGVKVFVDASHPYAANVSKNAIEACRALGVPYIRYERPETKSDYEKIFRAADYAQAAKKAGELGKNIFLAVGSRNLKIFVESPQLKDCTLTARVLPDGDVLANCLRLGFTPKNIIALQGPFSQKFNEEMFRHFRADVIVTKESGKIGGADTKFAAAKALSLPVVVIERPKIDYGGTAKNFADVLDFVKKFCGGNA